MGRVITNRKQRSYRTLKFWIVTTLVLAIMVLDKV